MLSRDNSRYFSFLYECEGQIYVEIQDIDEFKITPDCLPDNYSADFDCVVDQLIYQYMPSIMEFWDLDPNFTFDEVTYSIYEKQLCASYCTVGRLNPVVKIIPCEESFSCCKTEIKWNRNNDGDWIPGPIDVEIIGECTGPSPKCSSGFPTFPSDGLCESRSCFQPTNY